ncbi:hypothetical protein ACFZAG_39025 [Streptomyces sp. NPDC012403]|uniref:hypothetical protein n=1 Tax=unclassified Streptomyces TaxID=2593676 RepID=UPI0020B77637|nr:hypothetical protein [Streptomyces sp. AC558_RSS880]
MTVRRLLRGAAALALATAAMMAGGTTQAHAADSWANCPYGAVCIYPQNQNPAVSPSHVFWAYGPHRIYNQFGYHWVLNNQSDYAFAHLCRSVGTDCYDTVYAQEGLYFNLDPINSVTLSEWRPT